MFLGRDAELADLRAEFDAARPSLVIMFGRRRVGKSTLIQRALEDRPFVYFQATRDTDRANLDAFKDAVAERVGQDPILASLGDWAGMFQYLSQAEHDLPKLAVVIDEFPYLKNNGVRVNFQ
jgi:AAA+ ATPase superfamily predicted ATPase